MKNIDSLSIKTILMILVMVVFVRANAQIRYAPLTLTDMHFTIENDVQVSPTELQFDLYLKDIDASQPFELAIIQAGIIVSPTIFNGGTITPSIVPGYSDLVASQQPNSCQWSSDASGGCIKMTPRPAPNAGSGTIIFNTGLGSRVTRIRLVNTVPFTGSSQASLTFSFLTSPYPTKVFEYISGVSTLITTNSSNTYTGATYQNILLNPLPIAYNVTGGGNYCEGSNSDVFVGVSNSQLGVTYWLYAEGVITTISIVGTGSATTFENQSGTLAGTTYAVKGIGSSGSVWMTGSVQVALNPLPVISFSPLADVCVGSNPIQLSATPANGVFSGQYVTGTLFDPSIVGTYQITYNYTDPLAGCIAVPVTQSINVNPTQTPSVTIVADANPVCSGTPVIFSAFPVNGGTTPTFQWYNGLTPVGTNDPTYSYVPESGDVVSVVMTSSENCVINNPATSNSITISVNPIVSDAGPITGPGTFTPGDSGVPYSIDPITNATGYTWIYTGTGVTINGTGTNVTLDFLITATSGQLKVKGFNTCGNGAESSLIIQTGSGTKQLNISSVMLEGLYNGGNTMRQANDEYGSKWTPGVADHIVVELHNSVDYSIVEFSVSDVALSTTGTSVVAIPSGYSGSYYLTIKHRNSIETSSSQPVDFSGNVINYTFDTQAQVYGSNLIQMIDGTYAIYAADIDQNGLIDGTDLNMIGNKNDAFAVGYMPEDVDGSGLVDGTDLNICGNNNDLFIHKLNP
jgi:hypothetical protein